VSKEKGKKRGRKSKSLTPFQGQDVDIPLVVGGTLVVGDTTFSPLTGGLNANKSSLGHSIGTNSYDDATIGENTVDQDTNDEMINSLTAIDSHDRQYFNELCSTVVSRRIFIRSQSLIAR
jgi:hypothetical protein